MIRKTAVWLNRLLWTVVVTVSVLVAAYVSIGRYYIDYVERFQSDLVARVVEFSGLDLELQKLYGSWEGLSPTLVMRGLVVHDKKREDVILSLKSLHFTLDPFNSLRERSLQIKNLRFEGVRGVVEEFEEGRWRLKDYPYQSGDSNYENIITLLLGLSSVGASDAQLRLEFLSGKKTVLKLPGLDFQRDGQFRRLRVKAGVDDRPNLAELVVESSGDPRKASTFGIEAYGRLEALNLQHVLAIAGIKDFSVSETQLSSEVWLHWQPTGTRTLQGRFSAPNLEISGVEQDEPLRLKNVSSEFYAERNVGEDDWHIWVPELSALSREQRVAVDNLIIDITPELTSVAAESIALAPLNQLLLGSGRLPEGLHGVLDILSPSGVLSNLHLNLPHERSADFQLSANLNGVSSQPWKGTPGAENINGAVLLDRDSGVIDLVSNNFGLTFPGVYKEPLWFESARAQLRWLVDEERIYVRSGVMRVSAEEGELAGSLSLDLPLRPNEDPLPPLMNLIAGFENIDARYRDKYLPYTLSPGLLEWLQNSIPGGVVNRGSFIYHGSLKKGDSAGRTVQIALDVDSVELAYHPQWPPLTDLGGVVFLDDSDIYAKSRSARVYESATVTAAELWMQPDPGMADRLRLKVVASAEGSSADGLRIVRETAIRNYVGAVFDEWQVDGELSAELKLDLLLGSDKDGEAALPVIDVHAALTNSVLNVPDYRLSFSDVHGHVYYSSEHGLSSKELTGKAYDKRMYMEVQQREKEVDIAFNGRLAASDVLDWSSQAVLTFASGETDFSGLMKIAPDGKSVLHLQSDMVGIAVDLPAPYGKVAEQPLAFGLHMPLGKPQTLLALDFSNVASLDVALEEGRFGGALLQLGAQKPLDLTAGIFSVVGVMPTANLDDWQQALSRYLEAVDTLSAGKGSDDAVKIKIENIEVLALQAFGQDFKNVFVSAEQRDAAWIVDLDTTDFNGRVTLFGDRELPLAVHFSRLLLRMDSSVDGAEAKRSIFADVDYQRLVDVDIKVDKLWLNEELLGDISFKLRHGDQFVDMQSLRGTIRGLQLGSEEEPALLNWSTTNGLVSSTFRGRLSFANLGDVLQRWDYEEVIESERGAFLVDLQWPAYPDQLEMAELNGTIDVRIRKGRFLTASGTASGALKVVGIFNFDNILRRLRFDFSDLFSSGVSFDKVGGEFAFADGMLTIADPLEITSPSSRFLTVGSADMVEEQLDMELIATLPIASNLPWVAAVVTGLPGMAGVYVASKVFEHEIDKFSSAAYKVTGSWDEPEVEFDRIFDDGSAKIDSIKTADEKKPEPITTEVPAAKNSEAALLPEEEVGDER